MATATDAFRIAKAHTPLGAKLLFREMSGREELSRPFDYRLELLAEDDSSVDPKALLGRGTTVELEIQGGGARYIDAQCVRFAYIGHETVPGRNTKFYRYEARLRPWTHYMTLASTCRVFQNQTVPDIIRKVLERYPFPADFRLSREYRTWEYCVQYQETDFNFMSRLLENEGIYYFFEHSMGSHTLVFADHLGAHAPLPNYARIPHLPTDKLVVPDEEYIDFLHMVQEMEPGEVALRDFDFKRPKANLTALAIDDLPYPWGDREIFEWPGGYWEPRHGTQYASTRLEELQQPKERVTGQSTVRGMTPGYTFTLERCPRRDQNREYLLTTVDLFVRNNAYHTGTGRQQESKFSFIAQPSQQPYRPARLTPKPRTTGPQTAIVAGLKNNKDEEIVCDEYGRVRVQFNWDREHDYDEESSCWIRVSSGWAGNNWGQISIPRVGQEVIVDFLNGDPDYPIIIGRVYNEDSKVPYALPKWKEYSTWKSRSTKHGGNNDWNEIRFYDYKGKEQVFIHAQWRMDVRVKWNKYETVRESTHFLAGACFFTTGGEYDWHVKGKLYEACDSDINLYAKGNIKVGTAADIRMGAQRIEANAKRFVLDGGNEIILRVGSNFVKIDASGVQIQGTMVRINCGGGAPPAPVADIDAPYDASAADTGEPGYLDRPHRGGGGGRGHWNVYNGSGLAIGGGKTVKVFRNDDGSVSVGNSVTIKPSDKDPQFTDKVLNDLGNISSTPSGQARLDTIENSGHGVTIERIDNGANAEEKSSNDADATKPGVQSFDGGSGTAGPGTGKGSDSTVKYNPDFSPSTVGPDPKNPLNPPGTVPSDAILFHEMGHSEHGVKGQQDSTALPTQADGRQFDNNEEKRTVEEENKYRKERGIPERFDHHNF
jgi:type VI secretion system secreted protein VgrG